MLPQKKQTKQERYGQCPDKSKAGGMRFALWKSLRITLVYLAVGCLWIIFSDLISEAVFQELSKVTMVSIVKGLFYVFATASLIFGLVYPALKRAVAAGEDARKANALLKATNAELFLEKEKLEESEKRLRESELVFRSVFEQAPVGIFIGHSSTYMKTVFGVNPAINPEFALITGRPAKDLDFQRLLDITYPDDLKEDLSNFEKLQSGLIKSYEMEKRYIRPDGSNVWVHMVVSRLYLEHLTDFSHLCIIKDITERKQQEKKLHYLSEHDPLTGLYNRFRFEEELSHDLDSRSDFRKAVLLVTLNKMDKVNITHGLTYGETLVKKIAGRIACFHSPGCQLFHIANDRYVFYIRKYEDKARLEGLCRKVIAVLDECLMGDRAYGAIGVLELDSTHSGADGILKLASIAAENAQQRHEDKFCFFDNEMEARLTRREAVKNELNKALRGTEDASLYLVYQPIFHILSNTVFGFEALARIKSEILGQISPNEFIPIAEETQLIVPLGKRIIRMACLFLKRLEEQGIIDKSVSINISSNQLLRDDFLPDLMNAVLETGVSAQNITLEITESIFSDNYRLINEKLGAIKEKGIAVSIDDFGTGYSSLARENELNVNFLKLDKQFVDGLMELDPREVIAGDIISMAHRLGHGVVAEGVEHEAQKQYLLMHHCDYIQGYLYSYPLKEEEAIAFIPGSHDGKATGKK